MRSRDRQAAKLVRLIGRALACKLLGQQLGLDVRNLKKRRIAESFSGQLAEREEFEPMVLDGCVASRFQSVIVGQPPVLLTQC